MGSKASTMNVEMPDGETVKTTLISLPDDVEPHLLEFWSSVRKHWPFVVGLDIERLSTDEDSECNQPVGSVSNPTSTTAVLLKLCNLSGGKKSCLIISVPILTNKCIGTHVLAAFLAVKEIKFVGFNISKEVEILKETCGLQVRNAVDLSPILASGRIDPLLSTRHEELPSWLVDIRENRGGWLCVAFGEDDHKRIQYATRSVYNAAKVVGEWMRGGVCYFDTPYTLSVL